MHSAACPACGAQVTLSNQTKIGQRVICGSCCEKLEVTWLEPIELDYPLDDDDSDDADDDMFDDED